MKDTAVKRENIKPIKKLLTTSRTLLPIFHSSSSQSSKAGLKNMTRNLAKQINILQS